MALVRYNPWDAGDLQKEINRLFSNWNGDNDSNAATAGWMPSVDIQEFTDRFQLFVDLPGIDPANVELTLDSGVLSISGDRHFPAASEDGEVVSRRTERGHGHFHRRFTLPDTVDAENVSAKGHNGVLEISIPKQAKAQPRRIEVAA